jgi:hypothetical protein
LLAFHKQAAVFFGIFALLEEFAVSLLDDIVTFSLLDETFATLPPTSSLLDPATIEELLSFETTNVPLDSGETTDASDGLSSEQATTPNNKAAAAIPRFALYTILSSITTNLIYINPLQKSIIG